ncbi:MAG: pilus assembly FimT family protein [Phycisphaerae bacterium]
MMTPIALSEAQRRVSLRPKAVSLRWPQATVSLSPGAPGRLIDHSKRSAFTMVELLTVLAIMVIVAAISIPAFAALFAGNNMVQAQNQLSTAVAGARTLAIQNHTDVALIFFEEPGHTAETAYAYEHASPGQSGSPASPTYFQPMPKESIQYLPKGVYVATLVASSTNSLGIAPNSDNGFAMPPQQLPALPPLAAQYQPNSNPSPNAAPLRAIVFDGNGHLTILSSMILQEPEQIDQPGAAATPIIWWTGIGNGTNNTGEAFGPSAPGFVLYEPANWPNPLPTDPTTGAAYTPGAYLATNSDITMISTYTGNVIQ